MLFLSLLKLNPRDRQVRRDIAQPYQMHMTLWNRFAALRRDQATGKNLDRILFRVDTDRRGANPFVLVQSDIEPDWTSLPEGYLAEPVKSFEPSFAIGQRLRFRLRANPTKKQGASTKSERLAGLKKNGKRVALFHENDQVAWLLGKGEDGGFTIPGQWREENGVKIPDFRVDVVPEGWVQCGKEDHRDGKFLAVRFDGILIVKDPAKFRETLREGIGSAKGFGFGLLSIAPAEARA
jgi:CRISPR system Cascade subunit CasE